MKQIARLKLLSFALSKVIKRLFQIAHDCIPLDPPPHPHTRKYWRILYNLKILKKVDLYFFYIYKSSQHRLLVGDFRVSIPPQPKRKFVPRIKVWKLRDPEKQAELSEVFKAKTLDSELSQTSTADERCRTSLKDKLLQATKQVCGVSSNHPWRKQTWWWNNQVEEAVREKRRCFKLWKAGGSRAAYNTAKRTSNHAIHQVRSEAEKVALQKIDPRSGDVYRLAKQMRRDNQDVMGEKPVKNDAGQLSLDEEAKKEAWTEH